MRTGRWGAPAPAVQGQVGADQGGQVVDLGAGQVGDPAGRGREGQFGQAGGDLAGVDGLEAQAAGDGEERQLGHLLDHGQRQLVELGRPQHRPADARAGDGPLRLQLGAQPGQRDAVRADDRDVHDVPYSRADGGAHQGAGRLVVALGAARQVQDGVHAGDGGLDALTGEEVAGDVGDAVRVRAGAAGEDPHLVAGRPQQRDDVAAEGARAAGDQEGGGGGRGVRHDYCSRGHGARGSGY